MCAEYPTSKWAQLKMYLLDERGEGLTMAMNGWMNAKTIFKK